METWESITRRTKIETQPRGQTGVGGDLRPGTILEQRLIGTIARDDILL